MRRSTLQVVAKQVGRRIAELRRDRRLTQEQFAEEAGFSARYLQAVEAGGENLTLESLVEFANLLGVPVQGLFEVPAGTKARPGPRQRR